VGTCVNVLEKMKFEKYYSVSKLSRREGFKIQDFKISWVDAVATSHVRTGVV
jgi:hypothetical protein